MAKFSTCVLLAGIIALTNSCQEKKKASVQLLASTLITDLPSASALEFFHDRLYVFGDDGALLAILDTNYRLIDTVRFLPDTGYRIQKETKPDIEAAAIFMEGKFIHLYAFGSMSASNRELIFSFPLSSLDNFSTSPFVITPDTSIIKQLNIEGACFVKEYLLLANRGNTTYPKNHLIKTSFSKENFMAGGSAPIKSIQEIILPSSTLPIGISGLYFVEEMNMLLFTASEENTPDAISDGTIGDSYLGIVKNFNRRKEKTMRPDHLIKLSSISPLFKGQKIESVALQQIEGDKLVLHLAADNDNGESTLCKIRLSF